MKRPIICLLLCVICGGLLVFSPKSAHASGRISNILVSIAAANKNDVWAVGEFAESGAGWPQGLLEHWNGHTWSVVPGANVTGSYYSVFSGVAVRSSRDVWAVGSAAYQGGGGYSQALIEHWNGRSWKVVPSPNPTGSFSSFLNGVSIVSEDDAWAVGTSNGTDGQLHPLIEHWQGSSWNVVSGADFGLQSINIQAVSAVSKNDVWVVGSFLDAQDQEKALLEHWNGKIWEILPDALVGSGVLNSISAVEKDDIWSVGTAYDSTNRSSQPLIEHWNGKTWQVVSSGVLPGDALYSGFRSVSARDENDVWALGYALGNGNSEQILVEHWDGKNWTFTSPPTFPGSVQGSVDSIVAISHSSVWMSGETIDVANNYTTQPLVANWNGKQWRVIASPQL